MKKKSSARSAMSELLSKQDNSADNSPTVSRDSIGQRRGFIETLDKERPARVTPAPRAERPMRADIKTMKSAPASHIPPVQRPSGTAPATTARPSKPQMQRGAAVKKRGAKRRSSRRSSGSLLPKAAKITAAAVLFICLCTGIISAVLLSVDGDEIVSDAVIGKAAEVNNADSDAPDTPDTSDAAVADGEEDSQEQEESANGLYRVNFTFYKRDSVTCYTKSRTIGEIVELMDIELDENEKARTDLTQTVSADTEINVDCVEYSSDAKTEAVSFETKYVDVQTIPRGSTRVYQQGRNGTKTIEYKVTYLNGVECEREVSREYISTSPTECVIYRGVGGSVSAGGRTYTYSYYIDCTSTVYTGGGTTASGVPASESVIAVDPKVIPLGTRVYVDGIGFRTAADTGGAIKGNSIDIYYNSNNPALAGYGRRSVRVYIF